MGALAHVGVPPIHGLIARRELKEVVSIFLCYPWDCFHESCSCLPWNCSSRSHELALRGRALEHSQVWEPNPRSLVRQHKHCNPGHRNQWQKTIPGFTGGRGSHLETTADPTHRRYFQSLSCSSQLGWCFPLWYSHSC